MEISNVCTPYSFDSVECRKNSGEKALSKESSGQVERIGEGEYRFLNRDSSFRFHFQDAQYQKQIEDMFARNYSNVVILHPINAESLTLDMRFFPAAYRTGQIEILVPEHIRQALVQHGEPDNLNRLAQCFLFDDGLHTGFLFSKGKHQDEADYEESKAADEKNKKTGKPNTKENPDIKENSGESKDEVKGKTCTEEADQSFSGLVKEGSLRLYGDKFDMLVNIERVGTEERVSAYRLIFHRKRPEGLLVKGIGTLSFSDTKSFITASVRQRLKETPNYLNSWDAYAAKEGNFLLNKARDIGTITCGATYNREGDAYVFSVMGAGEECLKQFSLLKAGEKDGDVLQCTEDVPVYLENRDIDWNRYEKDLEARENEERMKRKSGVELPEPPVLFRVIKRPASPSDSILKLSLLRGNMPEGSGRPFHFIYSIYGDERQISRRREARERIKEGRASMPSLGLILGGDFSASDYDLSSGIRGKKIAPLSPLVREKIFDNPPTEHQVRAIEIALNTPDIAVIQGPPGTGKTTVIRAIIERLNEISDKQNLAPGQVLVTSLQHDAVNNLVERLSINSLPTIKFGRKQSESQEDLGTAVRQWCENVASELEKKHDFLHETEDQAKLTRLFNQYFLMPDDVRAREFLEKARLFSTSAISEEIETILQDLPAVPSLDDQRTLLAKIYQLPVTAEGLSDHGAQRAEELLFELEERFGEDFGSKDTAGTAWQKQVRNILEKVINGMDDCALAEDLPRIRRELLGRFIPRPILQRPEPRKDIIHVYQKLHQLMTQPKEAMHMAIYEFYEELSSGSKAVEEALASYTFAFAATAQQSEGKEIKRAKNVKKPKEVKSHASYNTVIVDEAARVAPGDLMIPLSQAERRIILVGDQKQLPHIYDEEIFEKLREEGKLVSDDDIRESMFEHLWNIAKELEKHDHIPRTITLDKQYRTHPELGNFVSQNFYEADGEGFESPRKAEEFKQSITPHACIWVNLPDAKGTMQRRANGSKTREVEADYIVSEIDEYLKRPDCQGLSFGVITFYSSQRELVKQKLRKHGISPDNNDRLRVGTVDEFQGMEFDVIFLSVVRSVRSFAKEDLEKLLSSEGVADEYKKEKERLTIKYYGFLNDNRLCVALSRQKRLLIVVGNGDMFSGRSGAPLAKRCVTALYNLYARCESEGGSLMDKVKVISLFGNNHYSDIFPSISVLYETTRFVQFDAFALHLPVTGPGSGQADGELNIFELTMLRMLAAGSFSPQKIAEKLCLPPDFTAAVLAGLREKGYLTDQNTVSEIGSSYLGKKPGGNLYDPKSSPKTTFYVPVRRDTGEVIPVLFERDALETGEADFSGHRLTIWHGSAGKEEAIQGRMITVKRVHQKRELDQKEIRKIIRFYNQYSGQYMNIPADQFIESSFISGIFVQMKFVVQRGDVKYILASDGGRSHSTGYLHYMIDTYAQHFHKSFDAEMKRSALNYTERSNDGSKKNRDRVSYKYKKIRDNLASPKSSAVTNADEQTEYKEEENRSIREYLSAMEWALDAYLRRIGIPDSLCQMLQAQGGAANAELLFEMGKQAGIYGMETVKPLFLNVSFAAFTNWRKRGEPSLRLLFPLACGLQLRKPECTFAEAVGAMGTAMVLRLSKYAASVRHNERLQLEKRDTIDTLYGAVLRFVKTLLPDYESDETERPQKQAAGNASERRIAEEVWLMDQLGDDLYTMLPEEVKNSLLVTSNDDLRMVMEETAFVPGFILSLSSALEKEFQRIIRRPAAVKEIGFVQARLRGISALPSGLARVNPVRYQAAASGKKSTLGAYALVWAGTLSDEELENASKAFVLAKVDEIAGARGHGTGAEDFRKEDLEKLRSNTIDVIRYLENSYDGGGQ